MVFHTRTCLNYTVLFEWDVTECQFMIIQKSISLICCLLIDERLFYFSVYIFSSFLPANGVNVASFSHRCSLVVGTPLNLGKDPSLDLLSSCINQMIEKEKEKKEVAVLILPIRASTVLFSPLLDQKWTLRHLWET